jgi:hypothetical protein
MKGCLKAPYSQRDSLKVTSQIDPQPCGVVWVWALFKLSCSLSCSLWFHESRSQRGFYENSMVWGKCMMAHWYMWAHPWLYCRLAIKLQWVASLFWASISASIDQGSWVCYSWGSAAVIGQILWVKGKKVLLNLSLQWPPGVKGGKPLFLIRKGKLAFALRVSKGLSNLLGVYF